MESHSEKPLAPPGPEEQDREAQRLVSDLEQAKRGLRKTSLATGLTVLGLSMGAFALGIWGFGLLFLFAFVAILIGSKDHRERHYMEVALPTVLRRLKLEREKAGMEFNRCLPARLFPHYGVPLVTAVYSGTFGGCQFEIAEVVVSDPRGEADRVLFKGQVLRVKLSRPVVDFLILDQVQSTKLRRVTARSWFSGKPDFDVSGLASCNGFSSGVHGLGLWLDASARLEDQPLAATLKVLAFPPPKAGTDGRLYAATSAGREIFVARRPPSLSPWTGTVTVSKDQVDDLIHVTTDWLSQPVALARALIEASETDVTKG